jgi:arginine metabolism regulation protein II
VPQDAGFLLSRYKDHVIGLLSLLKYHRKTLWNILHLPCAMNTLAKLLMGSTPNHASLAVFYSLLAVSAFSLCGGPDENSIAYWKSVGNIYKKRAHEFLKLSLSQEVSGGPKRAKYKEILMAILSMVTISVSQVYLLAQVFFLLCNNLLHYLFRLFLVYFPSFNPWVDSLIAS